MSPHGTSDEAPGGPRPTARVYPSVLLCAVALAALLCWSLGCGAARDERYNLVIVLSDALRASNLPFHGYPRNTAPTLQGLTSESVVFEHHLANFPGTPTSVSQMMTGRLMAPLLMNPEPVLAPAKAIAPDLLILPRVLQQAGFDTAIVSSHAWFEGSRILEGFDRRSVVEPGPEEPYAPFEDLVPPAVEMIATAEEPFFLYLHSMDTHGPFRFHRGFDRYRGTPGWPEVYNAYDSEILYTDRGVAHVLEALRRRGVLERTVFVFTSDHGEELGEMGPEYWNRSHGFTLRRVQLHVPLLMRLPGGRLGGTVHKGATQHLDLAPTLLRLAAPDTSLEGFRIDGRGLGPDLDGTSGASDGIIAFTWRYWALHRGDLEVHWDGWRQRHALHRTVTSRFNYPMSREVDATTGRLPAQAESLRTRLDRARKARTRELLRMPSLPRPSGPILVGVPNPAISASPSPSTYDRSTDDDLWLSDPLRRLEAGPGEDPGPVTLWMPWVPGRYRVRVRLDPERLEEGWENRFRLRFQVADAESLQVDGSRADSRGVVDLGTHDLGRYLSLEISEPRGGVAIIGFAFEPEGAGATPEVDPALEERLRTLGYLD